MGKARLRKSKIIVFVSISDEIMKRGQRKLSYMRRVDCGPTRPEVRNVSDHHSTGSKQPVHLLDKADQIRDMLKHLIRVDNLELLIVKRQRVV